MRRVEERASSPEGSVTSAPPVAAEQAAREEAEAARIPVTPAVGPASRTDDVLGATRVSGPNAGVLEGVGAGGQLPPEVRAGFEARMGVDLSGVRIHTGDAAGDLAARRGAAAYTQGQHIVFGRGNYAPSTPVGRVRLAHELAHTVQQRDRAAVVQPDPEHTSFTTGPVTVHIWPTLGQVGATLDGEPWVNVRWTPREGRPAPNVKAIDSFPPRGIAVSIQATYDIRVTVSRRAEQIYSEAQPGETLFGHSYRARGAQVIVNEHLRDTFVTHVAIDSFEDVKPYPGRPFTIQSWDIERGIPIPPEPTVPVERVEFFWEFDTREQLQAFVAAHPYHYWAEWTEEGQPPTAIALDEGQFHDLADAYRNEPTSELTQIYVGGKARASETLYETYYGREWLAARGAPGDHDECVVFSHDTKSFGRRTLTHGEAINTWGILDMVASGGSVTTHSIDGHPFVALHVRGRSGTLHEIDSEYYDGRRELLAALAQRRAGERQYLGFGATFGAAPSWEDVLDAPGAYYSYLVPALDRDEHLIDSALRDLIDNNPDLANAIGERILEQAESIGRMHATWALDAAMNGFRRFTSEDGAKRLILNYPHMSTQERNDTLTFLGVAPVSRALWDLTLSNAEWALQVWMGYTINGVHIDSIRDQARTQINDLNQFKTAIVNRDIEPLHIEGEFGNEIRRRVYEANGWSLSPYGHPHESDADHRSNSGGHRPMPWASIYGSESGYLYAQAVAQRERDKRLMRYLTIAAVVVATVVLVLVANAAGAAVAGLLFTSATVGFVVTEVVVAAAIVTLVGPAMQTFITSGGQATSADYSVAYDNLGTQFVINLATFGFFKALGAATRAIAVAGAGGESAFVASSGWQAAETVLRIGTSGAAFFGIGVLSHAIETGEVPEGEALNELIFETALSLVLLEVGGYLARGPMEQIHTWSRGQRLGAFAGRMDALQLRANALNRDVAEFAAQPHGAKTRGRELLAHQAEVIEAQQLLVGEMTTSFRTRTDARRMVRQLERAHAEMGRNLAALREFQFLASAEIRPQVAGTETPEFTYRRGAQQEVREYYERLHGTENVAVGANGVIRVTVGDRAIVLRPSARLDPTLRPDGTRQPDVLDAWRATVAERQATVLRRAHELAESTRDLRSARSAAPDRMNAEQLRAHERLLTRAETHLDTVAAGGGQAETRTTRGSDSVESWRQRLVLARDHLLRQAEMLGMSEDPRVLDARKLPTRRSGLKQPTVERHARTIERARAAIDERYAARTQQATVRQQLRPQATIEALQEGLAVRQAEVRRRAQVYGTSKSAYTQSALSPKVRARTRLESLRQAEAAIERAELRLDALALRALTRAQTKHGTAVLDAARAGPLGEMSDVQVGDAMRALGTTEPLSSDALQGALYASMAPPEGSSAASNIRLGRVARYARSPQELSWVLETFGLMRQAGIDGSYQVMRDATASRNKWQGSVWQMEIARLVVGLERVSAFERPATAGGREFDIVLTDGTRIEAKDWGEWRPEDVGSQFAADLADATLGGTYAAGIRDIQWIFRSPPPASVAQIRSTMRATLESYIRAKLITGDITRGQAADLRAEFGDHTGLVRAPSIDRSAVHRSLPVSPAPMPPVIDVDDD